MYFYLDPSLADPTIDNNLTELSAVENLLAAAFEGHHVIFGEVHTLRGLAALTGLSARAKSVLSYLINWYSQIKGFYSSLEFQVSVEKGISSVIVVSPRRWRAPLTICGNLSAVTKACLLAENLIDSKLYCIAAEHYRLKTGLMRIKVAADTDGAGGSTTAQRFKDISQNSNSLCICITDSDRYSPGGSPASTSRKCSQIAAKAERPVWHITTSGRELENILPRTVFDHCLDSDAARRWQRLREIGENVDQSLFEFADLKEGVSVWWVLCRPKGSPDREYWSSILSNVEMNAMPSKCFKKGHCCLEKTADDELCAECIVIPPISRRLADSFLEWITNRSSTNALNSLNSGNTDEWFRIGQEVFGYCAAADRMRL